MKLLILLTFLNFSIFAECSSLDCVLEEYKYESTISKNIPKNIKKQSAKYIKPIIRISRALNVDPLLVFAVAWTETHFRPRKSRAGARGLLQIMPRTERELRRKYRSKLNHVRQKLSKEVKKIGKKYFDNIVLGAIYLDYLLIKFQDKKMAIIAYNMGPTYVASKLKKKQRIGYNHQYYKRVNNKLRLLSEL